LELQPVGRFPKKSVEFATNAAILQGLHGIAADICGQGTTNFNASSSQGRYH